MENYKEIAVERLDSNIIDESYLSLLGSEYSFLVLVVKKKKYILTKEKSFFEVKDFNKFLEDFKKDIHYKSVVLTEEKKQPLDREVKLFKKYLEKYKPRMMRVYGDRYLFGSVAVRIKNGGFVTTIRGKENFNDYTIVKSVDDENNIVYVTGKKATLNAPLLKKLFENDEVEAIVHINHEFDEKYPTYEYAFPGTKRDSERPNNTSFNIEHHGVFYLFNKNGKVI